MAAIYHFLIDRRTLAGLVLAGVLIGGLLFFAGLLVGLHQSFEPEPVQTATIPASVPPTSASPTPTASPATVSAPTRPAVVPSLTRSTPSTSLPTVRVPTTPQPRALVQPPSGRARSSRVSLQVAATSPGRSPTDDGETPASETEPAAPVETAAVAEPSPPPEPRWVKPEPIPMPEVYSVQVGAYREQRYLEAAMEDLEERGYSPYTVHITGAGGLVFQTVRIGRYVSRDEAIRAASEFQHRENMMALVRTVPVDMLEPRPSSLDTAGRSPEREPSARLAGL